MFRVYVSWILCDEPLSLTCWTQNIQIYAHTQHKRKGLKVLTSTFTDHWENVWCFCSYVKHMWTMPTTNDQRSLFCTHHIYIYYIRSHMSADPWQHIYHSHTHTIRPHASSNNFVLDSVFIDVGRKHAASRVDRRQCCVRVYQHLSVCFPTFKCPVVSVWDGPKVKRFERLHTQCGSLKRLGRQTQCPNSKFDQIKRVCERKLRAGCLNEISNKLRPNANLVFGTNGTELAVAAASWLPGP